MSADIIRHPGVVDLRNARIRAALAMEPTPGEWYWTDAYPAGERVFAEGSRRYRASRVGQDSD